MLHWRRIYIAWRFSFDPYASTILVSLAAAGNGKTFVSIKRNTMCTNFALERRATISRSIEECFKSGPEARDLELEGNVCETLQGNDTASESSEVFGGTTRINESDSTPWFVKAIAGLPT